MFAPEALVERLLPMLSIVVAGGIYVRGTLALRARCRNGSWRGAGLFAGGLASLAAAMSPLLDELSERFFAAHMIQHELIMVVAAPLLVSARSLPAFVWAVPPNARHRIARILRRLHAWQFRRLSVRPLAAGLVHGLAIWTWHVPSAFDAAARHQAMHAIQHLCFFGTGLLFWSSVIQPWRREARGPAVLLLFATAIHTSALGALLTFSRTPWYAVYNGLPGSLSAIEDQQLAGLLMWIPASTVYLVVALMTARRWLADSESTVRRAEDLAAIRVS